MLNRGVSISLELARAMISNQALNTSIGKPAQDTISAIGNGAV
jgi:hypothetical protein